MKGGGRGQVGGWTQFSLSLQNTGRCNESQRVAGDNNRGLQVVERSSRFSIIRESHRHSIVFGTSDVMTCVMTKPEQRVLGDAIYLRDDIYIFFIWSRKSSDRRAKCASISLDCQRDSSWLLRVLAIQLRNDVDEENRAGIARPRRDSRSFLRSNLGSGHPWRTLKRDG